MILVDSSVWIDYFRGTEKVQTNTLDKLLESKLIAVGDLMLTEVLQGFKAKRDFKTAQKLLTSFQILPIGGEAIALKAAKNYRTLRAMGFTVRKTIDTLIATRCIEDGHSLLHSDRDFDAFSQHLGLRTVSEED